MRSTRLVSPDELQAILLGETEHALIDVREIDPFSQNHLLFAVPLPLGRLELLVTDLLPRRSVPIIVCEDSGSGLGQRAITRLGQLGYSNVSILDGGIEAWAKAGFETYSGVNVPSKAFGEFVEHEEGTPSLSADELQRLIAEGSDLVVLDSRPFGEFNWASIPGGLCCPGAELVYRASAAVPSSKTRVIVNCAGRTRSIIGAQSLINAGLPNEIYALRNGIMGWRLSGYEPANGAQNWAPAPTERDKLDAKKSVTQVAARFDVQSISTHGLSQWQQERDSNSLFILDVRTIEEFDLNHLEDAVHAPGGQVVQATDEYIGVRNARIVLVDNDATRATMTASWLTQMGHPNIRILAMDDNPDLATVSGARTKPVVGLNNDRLTMIAPAVAEALIDEGALVLDMSLSPTYREGHIAEAWFVLRSQLQQSLASIEASTPDFNTVPALILTSEEGSLAALALSELRALTDKPIYTLDGGNAAWQRSGLQLTNTNPKYGAEPIDIWRIPFIADKDKGETVDDAMRAYLDWEVDLMDQLERDATIRFQPFPKAEHL